MQLQDAIRGRRMVRSYLPDPVPAEALDAMLRAGVRAPSAGFSQGWDFVVLTEPADRERFWAAGRADDGPPDAWLTRMAGAPALIVCLSDRERYLERYAEADKGWADRAEEHWPVPYWDVDTGMAAMLMLLTAVEHGLGACFFGVPPARTAAVLAMLQAPPERRIVGVVSVGTAAPDLRSPSLKRGRRPLTEVAHDGAFGVAWPGAEATS